MNLFCTFGKHDFEGWGSVEGTPLALNRCTRCKKAKFGFFGTTIFDNISGTNPGDVTVSEIDKDEAEYFYDFYFNHDVIESKYEFRKVGKQKWATVKRNAD